MNGTIGDFSRETYRTGSRVVYLSRATCDLLSAICKLIQFAFKYRSNHPITRSMMSS